MTKPTTLINCIYASFLLYELKRIYGTIQYTQSYQELLTAICSQQAKMTVMETLNIVYAKEWNLAYVSQSKIIDQTTFPVVLDTNLSTV